MQVPVHEQKSETLHDQEKVQGTWTWTWKSIALKCNVTIKVTDLASKILWYDKIKGLSFEKLFATMKSTDKDLKKNHRYDNINGSNFEKSNITIKSTGLVSKNVTLG